MLELIVKKCDIVRITKILAKNNINSSISSSSIHIFDDFSADLCKEICRDLEIISISNYCSMSECVFSISEEHCESIPLNIKTNFVQVPPTVEGIMGVPQLLQSKPKQLLFPVVKSGEIYLCDFGIPFETEQGGIHPAIVVQNDVANIHSPNTIVIPCTSAHEAKNSSEFTVFFNEENMANIYSKFDLSKKSTLLANQIKSISKYRLIKFLGSVTEEFLDNNIQSLIDSSLYRKHNATSCLVNPSNSYKRDLNETQIVLLSLVDIKSLLKIANSSDSIMQKSKNTLELFGFDFNKKGVEFLLDAILIASKKQYFNIKTLSEEISTLHEPNLDPAEIERLIIARIKENFNMKKSPTIDFIRLVVSLLHKEVNRENNI